jgi:3-hydroxyacyl-CoA dehydrogenase/enoyl-CoA hydratase/3-hydroxybutyryl-CoA epimerase
MDANIRARQAPPLSMDRNIQASLDDQGVLVARIDMPGRAMNVFSADMMDSLEQLLNYVDATAAVKAVVLASGKSTFLVGADLEMIRSFTEAAHSGSDDALHALFGRLGRLFRRLEKSRKPYVAAINGLALGGGLEVALACHARVAADDKAVQLGLPEIKLGLLPGAGGTQRLPRLIDAGEAMRMLLSGDPVSPARALQLGLVQELAASDQLIEAASRRALALSEPRATWDISGRKFDAAPFDFSKTDAAEQIAALTGVSAQQRARYPAYDAIMKCVIGGWNRPMDQACHWEMAVFVDLIRNPVAGNMVRTLFLNRQRASREGMPPKSLSGVRVALAGSRAEEIRALLEKARAPLIDASQLRDQDISLHSGGASPAGGTSIAWLREQGACVAVENGAAGLWLADPGEHGRAAELVVPGGRQQVADAGRRLAQWLRATVLVTTGRTAFLAALSEARAAAGKAGCGEDELLLAVALAAARAWLAGGIADTEVADVAAVLSGMHPAYTGGPFTYLRQAGPEPIAAMAAGAAQRDQELFSVPADCAELFQALAGVAA